MKKYPILIDVFMAVLLSVSLYMFTYTGVISTSLHPALYIILTPIVFLMLKRKREREEKEESDK